MCDLHDGGARRFGLYDFADVHIHRHMACTRMLRRDTV